ncbi:glycosyltransferase, partial [bacterium]|nr:glycosyltransferase [bacterium]
MSLFNYSVVIPVYNSAKTLPELVERIDEVMKVFAPYELILIDDLSTDDSWEVMKKVKNGRKHIRLIRFSRNFGQAAASICGIREAKSDTIISIDDDLQFQPEDIPKLITHYDPEKHYAVFGVPNKKKRGAKGLMSMIVDYIIKRMAFKNQDSSLQ